MIKKSKIIFVNYFPFLGKFDYQRYEIESLKKNFKVELNDLSYTF